MQSIVQLIEELELFDQKSNKLSSISSNFSKNKLGNWKFCLSFPLEIHIHVMPCMCIIIEKPLHTFYDSREP